MWKYRRGFGLQILICFSVGLLALALAAQIPFTYTVEPGQKSDDWAVLRGFGDREQNASFSFRWTIDQQAELRLPDVGWPSRIGLVGVAPRPDNSQPEAFLATGDRRTAFKFGPENASQPPDEQNRLTFEASGPGPRFGLTPNLLVIGSETYQPKGDPRTLGLAVSKIYVKPQPGRFGLVLPPLASWLGWALAITLLFLNSSVLVRRFEPQRHKDTKKLIHPSSFILHPSSFILHPSSFIVSLLALAVVVGVRLAKPGWFAVNGASIAWGVALPLLVWALVAKWEENRRAVALGGLLVAGTLLVFYELVLAPFTMTLFVVTGIILLALALKHRFAFHLENIGLISSITCGAAWGLWQGRLPRTDDISRYHLYWINELDRLIRQGNFYPRWATDFSWEQGSAVFTFYPPLSRYLAEIFHLAGMTFNNATMLVCFLTLVVGATGNYFFAVELIQDRRGAILGGLAFCYFPFHIAGVYSGGAFAHLVAAALLPWVFWQITRLVRYNNAGLSWLWLGLSTAALAISNNPQLILFVPVALLYLVGIIGIEARAGRFDWRRSGAGLLAAGAIAFGLSAFYLLPATFESSKASLLYANANLEPTSKFYAYWPANLALWQPIRPNLEDVSRLFGTLHYWLAAAGLLIWLVRRHPARSYLILLGLLTGFTVFLQFSPSSFIWKAFPALGSVQFSSRLMPLGVVLGGPLIAGLAASVKFSKINWLTALTGLAAFGLMLYSCFYSLDYAYWPPSFNGAISKKALTEQVGNGDVMYLPKGVVNPGEVDRARPPTFGDNRPNGPNDPDRLNWQVTGSDRFELNALVSRPATVTVPLFWFEGWWKITDQQGREYFVTPAQRTSLITLNLPPGAYRLTVKLQDSPFMMAGNWLSLVSLLALAAYFVVKRSLNRRANRPA